MASMFVLKKSGVAKYAVDLKLRYFWKNEYCIEIKIAATHHGHDQW